jgi:diacylglycerol kinase (ATP)
VSPRRSLSLIESFNHAIDGIVHVLRTHRNMRVHFAVAIVVLVAAVWEGVTRFELIALMIAIAFVLVAEMINSAVEQAIDVSTTSFDPLAKLAKDIAAGAVLIAAITAVGVGYLVFSRRLSEPATSGIDRLRNAPVTMTLAVLVLVTLIVIATKAWTGRGTPLRGGLPSGHAAIAFAGWMAVTFIVGAGEHRFLVSSIMLIMALLVAQTRVEAGFHSTLEVAYGGLLGALVALAVFQLFFH